MRLYTPGRHLRTALQSVFRNNWMTAASIGSVVVGLLIFGIFMLMVWNLNALATEVEGQLEITVFLEDDLDADRHIYLGIELEGLPGVRDVTYVSREMALQRMEEQFGADAGLLAGLREDNILWDTFEVRVVNAEQVTLVATMIEGLMGVDEVLYGKEYVEQLLKVTHLLRLAGLTLMGALAVAATFMIANTIRITVFARSREISIMKYVGATNWFIRWPFIIEGWLLGLFGALLAGAMLHFGYLRLVLWITGTVPFINLLAPHIILSQLWRLLLIIGSVLGIVGSTISLRKFLRV